MSRPGSKKTNHNKARTTTTSSSGTSSFHQRFQAFRRRTKLSVGGKQQQEAVDDVTAEFFSFRSDDDDPLESSTTTSSSSSSSSRPVHSILKAQHSVRQQAEEDDHDIHHESSLEHKRERRQKSVRFSHIRQSYHTSILGDHPLPEEGPPLTLSWEAFYHETIPIDNEEEDDESVRQRTRHTSMSSPPSLDLLSALQAEQDRRRHAKTPRRWSADERTNIVMSDGNKHHAQRAAMARVQRESRRIRRSREHEWMRYLVWQQEQEERAKQCHHDLEHDARLDLLLM